MISLARSKIKKAFQKSNSLFYDLVALTTGVLVLLMTMLPVADIQAQTKAKPNIIFILTDDQTVESLSKMPYVNGRSDWVRFDKSFVNFPLCCPSRVSALTGKYSHHTGVEAIDAGPKFDDSSSIATWMQDAGYRTGFIGKYLNGYPSTWRKPPFVPPGWDSWVAKAYSSGEFYNYYLAIKTSTGVKLVKRGSNPGDYATDVLKTYALAFIKNPSTKPFFLHLALNAPHKPYLPAPRHEGAFSDEVIPHPPNYNEEDVSDKPAWVRKLPKLNEAELDARHRAQYSTLPAVDEAVRAIFDALQDKGILNNTIVVFTSDNGYSWGAHRVEPKLCEYDECIGVPLLIRYPGVAGKNVSELVSTVDLAPTITAAAGFRPPATVDGRSLLPLVLGQQTSWRDAILIRSKFSAELDFWGIRTPSFKYVELLNGERELYDLRNDPYELQNVAGRPEYQQIQYMLGYRLRTMKK